MDIFDQLLGSFGLIFNWVPLAIIFTGVLFGIAAGAMPGLSSSIAVALFVPFTYGMKPSLALILLSVVYLTSSYGGSITAIAINTPGTPEALATSFDGYPLTKQGKPGLALGTSIVASTIGGIFGTIILILFSQPLALFALSFGPPEYFLLAILGLTVVVTLAGGNLIKGIMATLMGLFLTTIGNDPFSGFLRFTFGQSELADGFSFIPALIGLFALGEIFSNIENDEPFHQQVKSFSSKLPGVKTLWKLKRSVFQSSLIGTFIGIIPGAGGTIATLIAYNEAKRVSKIPNKFGKGCLEGIAAAESANNAAVGGALIPLLTLGIPGSASTAVLIGALLLHGLVPGPELFQKEPQIIYSLFAGLIIANLIMLIVGLAGNKLFVKVISAPRSILFALIPALCFIGSYSVNNSMFDVGTCLGFGILGWILRRNHFPVAPVVLGLVLGFMIEANYRRAMLMGGPDIFFTRPVSLFLIAFIFLSVIIPVIRLKKKR
jgi:putative tricarboxylic transport membrane protein